MSYADPGHIIENHGAAMLLTLHTDVETAVQTVMVTRLMCAPRALVSQLAPGESPG
jgi:hypothetical protein